MERFQIGWFDKKKKSLPSISCPSWLSCNFPRINLKIFFTACCIPISAVVFDLVYSDTMVIWRLIEYTVVIFSSNSSNVNPLNGTSDESIEAAGASLIMMMINLLLIYMTSIVGLLFSPIVSSLKTSYNTSVSLQTEGADKSTPVGQS